MVAAMACKGCRMLRKRAIAHAYRLFGGRDDAESPLKESVSRKFWDLLDGTVLTRPHAPKRFPRKR